MMRLKVKFFLVFCLMTLGLSRSIHSQDIFGLHLVNNNYQIVQYDTNNGTFDVIVSIPSSYGALWSLTYDFQNDQFYTIGNAGYTVPSTLVRIDRCTQQVESLGNINMLGANGNLLSSNLCVVDGLSYDSQTQSLYATVNGVCNNPDAYTVVNIDLTNLSNPVNASKVFDLTNLNLDLDLIAISHDASNGIRMHGVDASPQTSNTTLYEVDMIAPNIGSTSNVGTYAPWTSLRGLAFNTANNLLYSFGGQQGNAWLRTIVPNYLPGAGTISNVAQFNLNGVQIRGLSFGIENCFDPCFDFELTLDCIQSDFQNGQIDLSFSVSNTSLAQLPTIQQFQVDFFQGNPADVGTFIGSSSLNMPLPPNTTFSGNQITLNVDFLGNPQIYGVINLSPNYQLGTPLDSTQFGTEECEFFNNIASIELPNLLSLNEFGCQGQIFEIFGETFSMPGLYNIVLSDANNCDTSIVELNLTFTESDIVFDSTSICRGATWGGQIISESGIFSETFANQFGCDSIVQTYFNVLPTHLETLNSYTCNEFELLPTSSYFVNQFGCDSIIINQPLLIVPDFSPQASFTISQNPLEIFNLSELTIINNSTNATHYQWEVSGINFTSSDSVLPTNIFNQTGIYTIQLIASNEQGCADTIVSNFIIEENVIFYVPNAFTPDGDLVNNVFLPIFSGTLDVFDYQLIIFNRWGEIVFESKNPYVGWDGEYGNLGIVQDGIYTWKILYSPMYSAEKKELIGHVTVLR